MNPYKWPYIGCPIKGLWYYEIQIGPIVFMWLHDKSHKPGSKLGFRLGRLYIWRDRWAWKWKRR